MTTMKIEAVFDENIGRVWEAVTSLSTSEWRSDLSSIEVSDDQKSFIEYTKQGYPTKFTITEFDSPQFYAFTMENDNISGKWTGEFQKLAARKTKIIFTEDVIAKKFYMKPFIKSYLEKQQQTYIRDLAAYLAKNLTLKNQKSKRDCVSEKFQKFFLKCDICPNGSSDKAIEYRYRRCLL
mgnify:CR=1 FL=1